jgi:hypothetical protein
MKNWTIVFLVLVVSFSCKKEQPGYEYITNYSFVKSGMDQRYFEGQFLPLPLSIEIQDLIANAPAKDFTVNFVNVSGGETTPNNVITDLNGIASTNWKLGNSSNHQNLKASIFDKNHEFISSVNFNAVAFRKNIWDTVSTGVDLNINDLVADKKNNITLMLGNGLYKQGQNYFEWQLDSSTLNYEPFNIVVNSKGEFYFSTWNGEVYKSEDHAKTWKICTKPVPNYIYWERLKISANDYLWITNYNSLLLCSRDGGNTWTGDSTGINSIHTMGTVYSTNAGILFYGGMNFLYKSIDDGKTWTLMQAPDYIQRIYVTDDDKIILHVEGLYGNSLIYKSTDLGETFKLVYSTTTEFYTTWDYKFVSKYNTDYFICFPGRGIVRTKDFTHFENYWSNSNLFDLFIDQNGILIAKENNYNAVYYKNDTTISNFQY